jgi:hypothetical protein
LVPVSTREVANTLDWSRQSSFTRVSPASFSCTFWQCNAGIMRIEARALTFTVLHLHVGIHISSSHPQHFIFVYTHKTFVAFLGYGVIVCASYVLHALCTFFFATRYCNPIRTQQESRERMPVLGVTFTALSSRCVCRYYTELLQRRTQSPRTTTTK